MSTRGDLLTAIITAIDALSLGTTAQVWEGERAVFNEDAVHPSIWVSYEGAELGELLTIGGDHRARTFLFAVYVADDSQADALTLLEGIEQGLPGDLTATNRITPTGEETREAAELDVFLYRQGYAVSDPYP